jgi:predicted 3-demethylubiquinone-9 3-methyltransferase (glyoxalase superfamily)
MKSGFQSGKMAQQQSSSSQRKVFKWHNENLDKIEPHEMCEWVQKKWRISHQFFSVVFCGQSNLSGAN